MRPEILFPLFSDVNRLAGVGPAIKKSLARLLNEKDPLSVPLRSLVFHLPQGIIDRRKSPSLAEAKSGDIVTLVVTVESHHPPAGKFNRKSPYKVLCRVGEDYIAIVYFNARADYINTALPVGEQRVVSGGFERYGPLAQITHPDIVARVSELNEIMQIEPVYGLTAGLSARQLRKIIKAGLAKLPNLPDWLEASHKQKENWQPWKETLLLAHAPQSVDALDARHSNRRRLAYDELLANQLALALVRKQNKKKAGIAIAESKKLKKQAIGLLPYSLTLAQQKAVEDIEADLQSGERMLRLLQGDVGSGKTVVALLAMLNAIEAGKQAAIMAPTELLAKQHARFIQQMADKLGLKAVLLTGSLKAKEYAESLEAISSGAAQIVIGTHALFQDKVQFHDLGLAVIDEQHRFGVEQRTALVQKSQNTHLLVMTATPIPRTLMMAAFGDMDSSQLTEKPVGRKEIATKAVPLSRAEDVIEGIGRALEKGEKVYWVCPLIEETEEESMGPDLAAAEARYIEFLHRLGKKVALVHGRMNEKEREKAMAGFAGDEFNLLVATTVVEVGVDVPEATIMVIEHTERFGLSQLHQLRGRVGRSDKSSSCILLYADNCGEVAKARIRVLRETNDGFKIAEEDYKLRGAGDILGTRQSGMPAFHFADMQYHFQELKTAHDDVKLILHRDPTLSSERGQALKCLLYLFNHDANLRLLEAG
jgi:ATP-dependent DNA helicase RecG